LGVPFSVPVDRSLKLVVPSRSFSRSSSRSSLKDALSLSNFLVNFGVSLFTALCNVDGVLPSTASSKTCDSELRRLVVDNGDCLLWMLRFAAGEKGENFDRRGNDPGCS
jgi:hypothetical protein